jgi:hypothetical protein
MSAVDVLAVMGRKRAPFRDAGMLRAYAACVEAYRAKGAAYMAEGNSAAGMFRRGFTGEHVGTWDSASRKTVAYAYFRAGQDCAQDEARAAVAELIEAAEALGGQASEAEREKWPCHNGITTAAKCGRCSRELRLRAALARVKGEQP